MKNNKIFQKSPIVLLVFVFAIGLVSCSSEPTLQSYFVEKSEDPNFISLTLPASILNIAVDSLEADQKEALATLKKLNVLVFRNNQKDLSVFDTESKTVVKILSTSSYTELMKLKAEAYQGSVSYLGSEDALKEIIVYAKGGKEGFVLIRVMGDGMNPKYLKPFLEALQSSNASIDDFKGLLPDLGL